MNKSAIAVVNTINKKISELTVDDIAVSCAEAGITVSTLCSVLARLLKAQRVGRWENGVDPIYVDDNNVQVKALSTALELLKLVSREAVVATGVVTHQMAPGDVERLEVIARELKGLETRLVDPMQRGEVIEALPLETAFIPTEDGRPYSQDRRDDSIGENLRLGGNDT